MQAKVGSFAKTVSAAPVAQAITGVGFTPKLLFLWTAGGTVDATWRGSTKWGFGFAGGTGASQRVTHAGSSQDAVATSNTTRQLSTSAVFEIVEYGDVLRSKATLTSFDADGFTLNWTTNDTGEGNIIHYLALGGSSITTSAVLAWNAQTTTGNQAVTGMGFLPDLVMHFTRLASISDTPGGYEMANFSAMTATDSWASGHASFDGAATSAVQRRQRTGKALSAITAGATVLEATLVSMDANGFTVNFTAVDGVTQPVASIGLKGGRYKVGSFSKTNGAAPAAQSVLGLGFQPDAVMLLSFNSITSATSVAGGRFSIGAFDGTSTAATLVQDKNGVTPTVASAIDKNSVALVIGDNDTRTIDAECSVISMDSDGFTLNWTTNNATATEIVYIAFGQTKTQALAGAMGTLTGTIAKQVGKALTGAAGAMTGAVTNARITLKALAGAMGTLTGAVTKATTKSMSGAMGALSGVLSTVVPRVPVVRKVVVLGEAIIHRVIAPQRPDDS